MMDKTMYKKIISGMAVNKKTVNNEDRKNKKNKLNFIVIPFYGFKF